MLGSRACRRLDRAGRSTCRIEVARLLPRRPVYRRRQANLSMLPAAWNLPLGQTVSTFHHPVWEGTVTILGFSHRDRRGLRTMIQIGDATTTRRSACVSSPSIPRSGTRGTRSRAPRRWARSPWLARLRGTPHPLSGGRRCRRASHIRDRRETHHTYRLTPVSAVTVPV